MSAKQTILIIEDQPGFRKIYEAILSNAGYVVLSAGDGEEGWETCLREKPDLVLLDLGLPKLDGFGVLERIRSDAKTKDIIVIIFSVMGEAHHLHKATDMGADDYIVKGLATPALVLGKIRCQLIGRQPMAS